MSTPSFDPQQYWDDRLTKQFSLEGVGWLGMTESFNRWMYKVRRTIFRREVAPLLAPDRDTRVLDVGSGTGMYIDLWHELGVTNVVASDFTDVAVRQLRRRYGDKSVVKLDITNLDEQSEAGTGQFDIVSAMDILFHIVDDDAYARAVRNLLALVKPGGLVVFTENFLRGPAQRAEHQVSRSHETIDALFRAVGGEQLRLRPAFIFMNTPVDSSSRMLQIWWRYLNDLVHRMPRAANGVGAAVYLLETLGLIVIRRGGPSTKLAIWRKTPVQSSSTVAS